MTARRPRPAVSAVDVAIIGYGPVGATAANLLGAAGCSVVVVEREPSVFGRARAVSTDEEVMRIWQRTGLADRLAEDMLEGRPIDLVDSGGRPLLTLAPASRGNGWPPQLFLHQPALEGVLRAGVARYPNVEVLLGHEWAALDQQADGVELTLTDLRTGAHVRRRAGYVLACDGGASPVRKALGIGFVGRTYNDRWIVIDTRVRCEWPGHDRLRFHCDPRRPAVDCPTPLGHHRWEFPLLDGDDEAAIVGRKEVWSLLSRHGITPEQVEVLRASIYNHHVRFAARWRDRRVFLLGDAAHVMPPWIGQGMAAGIRDAGNLCWKLAGVLDGTLRPGVLDSYEAERQPHARAVSDQAVLLGRIISERRRLVVGVRDPLGRLVMVTPLVGGWVRSARWFPQARVRAGFAVGTAARGAGPANWRARLTGRRSAVSEPLPQPWVLDGEGARRRLDDVLGPGWILLHVGRLPAGAEQWTGVARPVEVVRPGGADWPGAVVDVDGLLGRWLAQHGTGAVVVRPDRFVFAAARAGALPPMPRDERRLSGP
jgi:3-(3-hydroxy-phenyl)propionate hydroxylase